MWKHALWGLAGLVLIIQPAQASLLTFTGSTAGGPTFNRPVEDLSALSANGTAVPYQTVPFSVSTSGDYSFITTATFDSFVVLYFAELSPGSPLTLSRRANDDLVSFSTSGFVAPLQTGFTYAYVTTGFSNADAGAYSTTIGGPGTITAALPTPVAVPNIVTIGGDTTTGATFNRPLEDRSVLSNVGTNVRYDVFGFRVGVSGEYRISTTADGFDAFSALYQGAFNPLSPLVNALVADDDLIPGSFTTTGFAFDLTAGQDYFLVTTGFSNGDFGRFSTTIGGPGAITALNAVAVPAPGSLAVLPSLLGLLGWRTRPQAWRRPGQRAATAG